MNVDDIVKLVLAFGVTFAIAGISYQIMRLIGKLADTVQDLRKAVQNISSASDMVLEDYGKIRRLLDKVVSMVESVQGNILEPLKAIGWVIGKFSPKPQQQLETGEE